MSMRKTAWMIPIACVLGGVALGWLLFSGDEHAKEAAHDHAPAPVDAEHGDHAAAPAAPQLYTCSMHPQVRSNDPKGKCPICGMDLIPVPGDDEPDDAEAGDLPRLRLTSRAAALMRIDVQPAQRRAVQVPLPVFGRVGYDETRLRTIAAWAAGRIERLHVDFTGTTVQQGQAMFDLYSPTLIAAQEELLQAVAAGRDVEDARDRLRLLGLDAARTAALEQRGRVEDHLTIPAPLDGTVIERLAAAGDYVQTGQAVYRVADLSHLWVRLEVYESDLQWLAIGQTATFTTQAHPGETFAGTVAFIDPVLNERTRTVGVRVDVPNPDGRLKRGMFVRGTIQARVQDDDPLVIPATAPLLTGTRAVVYVQLPDADRPTFEPRDVTLGPRAGDWYVVRDGLGEGQLVVTHGSFKIDSELQIRGRPSMMLPRGGRPPAHDHGASDHAEHDRADQAREGHAPFVPLIEGYPLNVCVVSGLPLDAMGGPVRHEHDGRVVYFCCDGCLPAFEQDPAYYIEKIEAAQPNPSPLQGRGWERGADVSSNGASPR